MPSASEILFEEAGLTRWGRKPDFVAPKPLSARAIKRLGDALDIAEHFGGRFYQSALIKYGEAVTARKLYQECKFENSKRIPKSADKHELEAALAAAEERIDMIEAMRPDFATAREFIDANADYMLAEARCEIAQSKYASDEGASRRRNAAYRYAVGSHSRFVTDGYVKTGKFKMIDGERVPVLEKIE